MYKVSQVLFGMVLGCFLTWAAERDWKGPTVEKRMDGVVSLNYSPGNIYIIRGINPKNKLEYQLSFGCNIVRAYDPIRVYHDALSTDKQYMTWKENNLFYRDIEVHVHP